MGGVGLTDMIQLDITGLSITVVSRSKTADTDNNNNSIRSSSSSSSKAKDGRKGKAKAGAEGVDVLRDATLRIKEGGRYALIGRNGSGKTSEWRVY